MQRILLLLLLTFITLGLSVAAAWAEEDKNDSLTIALAFGPSTNEQDESFLATVMEGANRAQVAYGLELQTWHRKIGQPDDGFLSDILASEPDAILVVGFKNMEAVVNAAESHETTRFLILDGVAPPFVANAKSIIFREHEGSFLVGMIAALKSKTQHIAFIGGRDVPLIQNFAYGFSQGAHYVNPNMVVEQMMLGTHAGAWDDAAKAHTAALEYYQNGVDVIFAAAGASGMGVINAAQETGHFAIGVDRNQNGLQPGTVLTSMIKKVDVAVYEALKELHEGEWTAGVLNLGLRENALDYAIDEHNKNLLDAPLLARVAEAKARIIDRSLEVKHYQPGSAAADVLP